MDNTTKLNREEVIEKWKPILDKLGVDHNSEKASWLSEYAEYHQECEEGDLPSCSEVKVFNDFDLPKLKFSIK